MAPQRVLAVALAAAQALTAQGAHFRTAQTKVDVNSQQVGFFERNMAYLMPLPYVEGQVMSLFKRMDLSVLFPEDAQNLAVAVPNPPKVPQNPNDIDHPVLDKDGKVKDHTSVWASVISTASTLLLWVVAVAAAAFFYRQHKDISEVDLDRAQKAFKDQPFKHGPFDCFSDMDVCCWSFWCGGVQWADSIGAVGILSFWVALAIITSLQFVNFLSGIVVWILAALVFTYFRQELRRKMGLQNETEDMVKDAALWCCCQCCAIVQEARQVKEARALAA